MRSPAEEFKKTVKRDKAHYKILKTDKQWDSWNRSTISTARTHGCEDVLDSKYVPRTQEAIELFDEKQKFMYSVFEDYLQTDKGKYYVRKYAKSYNAQAVYKDLSNYARESTQASLDSSALLMYLLVQTLQDSGWRGTTHAYILNWCDKLRQYEDLIDQKDHFTGNVKKIMLENAVRGVKELHSVKTQSDHDVAHGKRPLSYDQYLDLLLSAATNYDETLGPSRSKQKRIIQQHQFDDGTDQEMDVELFDIDTDMGSLQINKSDRKPSGRRPFRPSMKKEQWNSLSPEEQASWDKLS